MSLFIEELSLNAWPALKTMVHQGWLLRFSEGYTKRSNSIQAIYTKTNDNLDQQIAFCEEMYAEANLQTIFKITPFVPETLDQRLEQRGYRMVEPSSVKILNDIEDVKEPHLHEILIEHELSEKWLQTMANMNRLSEQPIEITRRLLTSSPLRQGFFTLLRDARPVACGLAVIEQGHVGLYDIVTDEACRNRGYGEQLLLHILKWARENGALKSYLLVLQGNVAANRLYEKLNYQPLYTYWYRCRQIEANKS